MSEEVDDIWHELDAQGTELGRAVSAAFAFVACADGSLAEREVERFAEWATEQSGLAGLDLEARLRQLHRAFALDFDEAERHVTTALAAVKDDAVKRETVLTAARIAVVADGRLEPVEEAALRRVCEALGVEPDEW